MFDSVKTAFGRRDLFRRGGMFAAAQALLGGSRPANAAAPAVAGKLRLGAYDPLPSGAALRDYWFRELDKGASRILRAVCAAHPDGLTKDGISEATSRDGAGTTYAAGGTSMRGGR